MKIIKNERGFVVSVTAIIVSVILGLMVMYYSNSAKLNVTGAANTYSSTQAQWTAISGVDDIIIKLHSTGLDDIAGTYPFYNSNIVIDTATIDPANHIIQITSRGEHSSSIRIFSLSIQPSTGDTVLNEGFNDGDSLSYSPNGAGPGNGRYWGLGCEGAASPFLPTYVLTGADSCFFFGVKIQNHSNLNLNPAPTEESQDYILKLSLAAGVDVANVNNQSKFQTGDYLEFYVNGILIERWQGTSMGGGQPLTPRIGNSTDNLTPNFEEYSFNITQIIGQVASMQLTFEGKTNHSNKYLGIQGLSLYGAGGWDIVTGSYKEI